MWDDFQRETEQRRLEAEIKLAEYRRECRHRDMAVAGAALLLLAAAVVGVMVVSGWALR